MSDNERLEALANKLRKRGLMFPEYQELCELMRERDKDKYVTKNKG